jgi:hypothetical protein
VEPHLKLLRGFRDRYLLTNAPGRSFARVYYKYGPHAATYIEEQDWLKSIIRVLLMPLVAISHILLPRFVESKHLDAILTHPSLTQSYPVN